MLIPSKQKQIESKLIEYRQSIFECIAALKEALSRYCKNPDRDALRIDSAKVHKAESRADDIRREIEVMMYSKALFPESRGDILGLLETMDRVPNQAESVTRMILNQYIKIPQDLTSGILQLLDVCSRCVDALLDSAEKLFVDFTTASTIVGKIDELESEADNIEAGLIEKLFSTQPDSIDKILLRDLIEHIAGISDRAENAGDRIRIIVAKRGV